MLLDSHENLVSESLVPIITIYLYCPRSGVLNPWAVSQIHLLVPCHLACRAVGSPTDYGPVLDWTTWVGVGPDSGVQGQKVKSHCPDWLEGLVLCPDLSGHYTCTHFNRHTVTCPCIPRMLFKTRVADGWNGKASGQAWR